MEVTGHKAHGAVPEPGSVVIARVSFAFIIFKEKSWSTARHNLSFCLENNSVELYIYSPSLYFLNYIYYLKHYLLCDIKILFLFE